MLRTLISTKAHLFRLTVPERGHSVKEIGRLGQFKLYPDMNIPENEPGDIYKHLYDNSPDMLVSVSPQDGSLLSCNQTLLKKTGFFKSELIGRSVFSIYDESCQQDAKDAFKTFQALGKVSDVRLRIKKKSGGFIPVLLNVSSVKDQNGKILYSISSWRDITEQIELEQKVEQSNKKLRKIVESKSKQLHISNRDNREYLYASAHYFREPVRTVCSFSKLLKIHIKELNDAQSDEYLDQIVVGAQLIDELFRGLINYNRLENSDQDPFGEINMNLLLNEVLSELSKDIIIKMEWFKISNLDPIIGNDWQIKLVCKELINNALRFRQKGIDPYIEVQTYSTDEKVTLCVSDNGVGIADEYHHKIFQLFYSYDSVNKQKYSGIGLAQCRRIAELHQADLWVESKVEEGSRFCISFTKHKPFNS